ncbi:N-acetylglucosamine-6-phosphate deacetylase [Pseudarthrobacter phenanthrenivorans]|uniref:N-acetylglucosamine-6-phosphate deacetylase n=1 Tax=Pseudarthrobacter phenanthrenivorans TaxID=361575 RepID=UPI00112BC0EE|nr:N-acetylglucosamine-6-phosphate deacetylase [Pseudarthrobacter phenanthrenivorans]TPV51089.1 N-acetylglucosamine-6-phosphate deacetylase [Pseudarthrobacter phenanthrenivorans]
MTSRTPPAFLLSGTIVTDGTVVEDAVIAVSGERIAYAGLRTGFDPRSLPRLEEVELPPGTLLLPGLVDLHCHGAAGGDFPGGDLPSARSAVDFLHASGTTTLLASLVTAPREDLLRVAETLRPLSEEGLVAGIHAEGPFLSHARCGAQDPRFLLEPDLHLLRELVESSVGYLRAMTYAPELPGAAALVQAMVDLGVTPSLGHTNADASTTAASLTQAANLLASALGSDARPTVTHLFNGMPSLHHRDPGPVAACLRLAAAGTVAVELVADGVHLHPDTVRMVFALVGGDNVILVTDSMAATGLPDGDYDLGPAGVKVHNGEARLRSNGALAGGTATLLDVVRRTVEAGVDPASAVVSATAVPARILDLQQEVGSLRSGLRADILAVDRDFRPIEVFRRGLSLPRPTAAITAAPAPAS